MGLEQLGSLVLEALMLAALVSLPVLGAVLLAGVVSSAGQQMFGLREPGLLNLPRLLLVFAALLASGSWMGQELVGFTTRLWAAFP